VYCLADEEVHLMRYLNGNLDKILSDHKLENTAKAGMLYDTTLVWIRHLYIEDKQRVGGQLDLALRFIDGLFACLTNKKSNIALILDIMRRDSSLYSHCLNVCLMGLAFSNYLKWTSRDAQAFGLGAILYDIGMSEINQDILQKKGSLNEEEFEEVRRHPMLGFQILKNYAGISWEPLLMSLQHHENGDGSGYPEGLWLNAIHPWARILRILDSYEAMTAEKCWRPAHPPQKALWMMREDWRKSQKYDANYLQAFIKFLAG
jgi:HD-GYP domain-containing protein (c-di-GMP phosphodiesterase class II)